MKTPSPPLPRRQGPRACSAGPRRRLLLALFALTTLLLAGCVSRPDLARRCDRIIQVIDGRIARH